MEARKKTNNIGRLLLTEDAKIFLKNQSHKEGRPLGPKEENHLFSTLEKQANNEFLRENVVGIPGQPYYLSIDAIKSAGFIIEYSGETRQIPFIYQITRDDSSLTTEHKNPLSPGTIERNSEYNKLVNKRRKSSSDRAASTSSKKDLLLNSEDVKSTQIEKLRIEKNKEIVTAFNRKNGPKGLVFVLKDPSIPSGHYVRTKENLFAKGDAKSEHFEKLFLDAKHAAATGESGFKPDGEKGCDIELKQVKGEFGGIRILGDKDDSGFVGKKIILFKRDGSENSDFKTFILKSWFEK